MDATELKELIKSSDEISKMRGGNKEPSSEEQVTIDFAFATVVSIKDISKGEELTYENIWVKRPGTGEIKAKHFKDILGRNSSKTIKKDEHLTWECIV